MHDFWSYESYIKHAKKWNVTEAKVITAIGMFYDLEEPNKFINDIAKTLKKNGIFVAQLNVFIQHDRENDLGNICHEHIEFYSLESLRYMFESNGLEIFQIDENSVNGEVIASLLDILIKVASILMRIIQLRIYENLNIE